MDTGRPRHFIFLPFNLYKSSDMYIMVMENCKIENYTIHPLHLFLINKNNNRIVRNLSLNIILCIIFGRFSYSKMAAEANNTSFTNVFGELAQNTGMHGLPNIYRSGSLTRKSVWTIILIAGLGKLTIIIK